MILDTEIGWFEQFLDPMKKPIFKIAFSRNSQNSVRKPNFFPRQALPIFFCFTLSLHWWYSTPSLICFGQLLQPMKKNYFLKFTKIHNSRNSQISVWKPNYFLRLAITKILFALHSHYTGDTRYRDWFDLNNSLTRWKRSIFKVPFRNSKIPSKRLTFS